MISWQLVVLVIALSFIASFVLIYIKEYKREQQAINSFLKMREEQMKLDQEMLNKQQIVYLMPTAAPKKKSVISAEPKPVASKDKKNIN